MQENQHISSRRSSVKPTDDSLSLKSIVGIIVGNKLIIAVCAIVALIAACIYLHKTAPIYSRYTTVLVKEKRQSTARNVGDQISSMAGIGSVSIDNEMEEFKSPYLMYMVIKKLGLNTKYTEKKLLRVTDLYGKEPFTVSFPDAKEEDFIKLTVKIADATNFEITSLQYVDSLTKQPVLVEDTLIKARAFQCISTPAGKIIVQPTERISAKSAGRAITVSHLNPNSLADGMAGALSVGLANKLATIFNMTYQDQCPKRAEDILVTLLEIYKNERSAENKAVCDASIKFIDSRLVKLEDELGSIDSNIEGYKSYEMVTNVGQEGMSDVSEQKRYSGRALDAENQLEIAKYIKDCLTDTTNGELQLLPSNVGINDNNLSNLIKEYNALVLKRSKTVANSSVKNPLVKEMDETLKQLRSSIESTLVNVIHTSSITVNAYKNKEAQINRRIARNPKQEKYLQTIGRQQKIKETLYLFLLQKREENELTGNMDVNTLRVITPARGSNKPISPVKPKILGIALLAGIGLPIAIIWLLLTLDGTVKSRKDIEGLSIPFLGSLPLAAKIKDTNKKQPVRILVEDKNRNGVNEAFRVMRSNFTFMAGHDSELILFTSYFPNSGKTFVSTNLAVSLALMGKRILLVDFDLRKAEMSKNLCNKRQGVSSILNGDKVTLKECICKSNLNDNIDILPSGVLPPNPAELLLNDKMEKLMQDIKGKYDYVFMDGTPLNLVADASIVGRYADLVLFVMREGQFQIDALPDLEELYKSGTFKRMATILNGSLGGNGAYGTYHRYGSYGSYSAYGYNKYGYDSYGYGENKD